MLTIHNKSSLSTDHFRSGSEELKLSVTCEDAYFDKITYSIDNALPVEIANQAETAPLDIEGDGMHSVKVSCLDKAGNETSDTLSIFIDNTPPEIVFTPHNIPTSSRSSADVTFSVTEENLQKLEYAYIWNNIRFPNSGFYEIAKNGSGNYSVTIPASADAANIDLEGKVSDFIVEIKAADKAKNQSGNETAENPFEQIPDPHAAIEEILFSEEADESELLQRLCQAIDHLTANQRDLIHELYGMKKKIVEIAQEQNVSPAAIRDRRAKIFKRIEKLIKELES